MRKIFMSSVVWKRSFMLSLVLAWYVSVAHSQAPIIDSLEKIKLHTELKVLKLSHGQIKVPRIRNYQVELVGSDNKAVIDLKGYIHQPIIAKSVNLLFKLTRKRDGATLEIPVKDFLIAGKYPNSGVGSKPFVIPSLREWHGEQGVFALAPNSKIVLADANDTSLKEAAKLLKEDLIKLLNIELSIVAGKPDAGDIYLTTTADNSLGDEGYALKIGDVFQISAPAYKGFVFGTRTLLQLLAQNPHDARIPKGESRDYPSYEVRGLVLDVGRKFFSIDFLNKYVEFMSYYKMSNFQIHLNDNAFAKYFNFNWDKTPAGFRLENHSFPGLTSTDGHYTKQQFIALQKKAQRYGISIIPELDVPAHALSIVKAIPEIGSDKYGRDHLDLSNPKTKVVVEKIFKEYISGANPVFIGEEVHIGTDEYDKKEAEQFRDFTDFLIRLLQREGKKVRAWGALTHAKGNTPVTVDRVSLNMWYNGYADPIEMKQLGYKQISTPDAWLYIVPAAGYYYDYLNTDYLYNHWEPRQIGNVIFEKGDPVIRGGMFALWNDIAGNGISEYDAHNRIFPAMQVLAEKMWSASDANLPLFDFNRKRQLLNEAPGLNIRGWYLSAEPLLLNYTFESSLLNEGVLKHIQASARAVKYTEGKFGKALAFIENESFFRPGISAIGGDYTVSFWIKPGKNLNGNLFSSKDAAVFASKQGIAYQRDGYVYELGDLFPLEQWSFISITGDQRGVQFYLNGKLFKNMNPEEIILPYKDRNGQDIKFTKVKTLQFPLDCISLPSSLLDQLKVYNRKMNAEEVFSAYNALYE